MLGTFIYTSIQSQQIKSRATKIKKGEINPQHIIEILTNGFMKNENLKK